MFAQDIMTRDVITILPGAPVDDAIRRLSEFQISGMPVVDRQHHLVGIITEADVLARSGDEVADIMTRRVIAVEEKTPVDHIAQLLTSNRIKRVPVLEAERVVGIVSRADVVRMLAGRWTCGVCGAIHLGSLPDSCDACGASSHSFTRAFDRRLEITSR